MPVFFHWVLWHHKVTEEKLDTTGVRDTKKRKFQLFERKLKINLMPGVLLNV